MSIAGHISMTSVTIRFVYSWRRRLVRFPFFCCILIKIVGNMLYSDVFCDFSKIFCQMEVTLWFRCIHQEAFMHKATDRIKKY